MRIGDCVKCGGEMVQGFSLDFTHGGRTIIQWAEGPPERSFWTGTKMPKAQIPIASFRCRKCGYLEFYAREEFAPK